MRLVMMGTGPFAVPTFEALLASTHHVAALITRPATVSQTRGKARPAPQPMRDTACRHGIAVFAPDDVNAVSASAELRALHPDLWVVCDYGQILTADTLAIAPLGGINLHGSLLPKYRGAAPVNWAIWQGESETGVTVLHMTPRLDAGPALIQARTAIGRDETAAELESRLAQLGVGAVLEALRLLESWDRKAPLGVPQNPDLATRAPRLKKSDGRVHWHDAATTIYRQFRALQPWPGLFTEVPRPGQDPLRLLLLEVRPLEPPAPRAPGEPLVDDTGRLMVAAGSGAIAVERVQPAGRKAMSAAEFLRGYPLHSGLVWGTAATS